MSILGIDEVGRGPLAGPLVVGAVILPSVEQPWFTELKDSKKLTAKKREHLNELILQTSTTGLGWVPAIELDQLGISGALKLATRRAVKQVQSLHAPFSQIIIDGKVNFLQGTPLAQYTTTCIKADAKIREVSAASIIAKVARDHYMTNLNPQYPAYHFDQHVGYGTKAHVQAIYQHGLTPEHRRSFEPCKSLSKFDISTPDKLPDKLLDKLLDEPSDNLTSRPDAIGTQHPTKTSTTSTGHQAEQAVANYLTSHGHQIVAQNHKTYFYEIDLISIKDAHIYFTEVKYRKSHFHGSGLEAITPQKLHQMRFAAESYLKYTAVNLKLKHLSPLLAAAAVTGDLLDPQIEWFPLT